MGEVIQFQTKAERDKLPKPVPFDELGPEGQFTYLYHSVLAHARDLTVLFRRTGKFTPDHEQAMIQIIGALKAMSANLTGYTGDSHGPTENVG